MIDDEVIKAKRQGIAPELVIREFFQKLFLQTMSSLGLYHNYIFQGGTCVRIFYGSPRFSADLDFTVLNPINMGGDVLKIVKRVQELVLPLDLNVSLSRESLQKFYMIIESNKYGSLKIKIEFLARQDKGSLKFKTAFLESEYPIKSIYPLKIKVGEQILADKITSFAGGFAKGIKRIRDLFDIYWLLKEGYKIDTQYLLEIFGSWQETIESLADAISYLKGVSPKEIIDKLGILIPPWLRIPDLGEAVKIESLRILEEAYSLLSKEMKL